MDYPITNRFSDALKYGGPPCDPIETAAFINHLRDGILYLEDQDKNRPIMRNREMYVDCLESYFRLKGIKSVIPDEDFFFELARDFAKSEIPRRECREAKPYLGDARKAIPRTIRSLMNVYFFPRGMTGRLISKLDTRSSAKKKAALLPLCAPLSSEGLIRGLHEANRTLTNGAKRTVSSTRKRHIEILKDYLDRHKIESLVPDETFLLECLKKLQAEPLMAGFKGTRGSPYYSSVVKTRAVREIRTLVNRYFVPKHLVTRPILLEVIRRRFARFFSLTQNTQRAVAWFEEHGKVVKALPVYYANGNDDNEILPSDTIKYIYRVTDKKLLPKTVYGKINHVLNFLRIAGKRGVEEVDEADVQKFIDHLDRNKISQKQDYLAHTATFFINARAEGFIRNHPFKRVSLKMSVSNARVDFIPQEGIDKLMSPVSIDFSNPIKIRNAVACRLAYDTGLRLGELYGLNATDIAFDTDGDIYVSLDQSIQKGRKPKNILYLLFDETKSLLRDYLEKFRSQFKPQDDALFVSIHDKKRLCRETLAAQMNEFLAASGIKTFYKKKATAHHLRHSFATLNIEPLGVSLSLYQVVERLRHTKHETAQKHYIHNNPYLQKKKFEAFKNRIKKRSNRDILRGIPLADLETFLMEELRLDPETMKTVRRKYFSVRDSQNPIDQGPENGKIATLRWKEIEGRIRSLGIRIRCFKEHCRVNSFCVKRGRDYYFVDSFIDELTEEWIRKEEVMRIFRLSRRRFYQILEERKWPTMKIGYQLLVKARRLVEAGVKP